MSSLLKSLKARHNYLAKAQKQVEILEKDLPELDLPHFRHKLMETGLHPLKPVKTTTFQVNLGKMCNQTCTHCHVDAGPDRKEIMTRETMESCLNALRKNTHITTVDLTGGAPEMNPHFRWFVEQITALGRQVIVRCNLTIIVANKKYNDLPRFYKNHNVEVVSSLPCYTSENTDGQRGSGVFAKSIKALQMLNEVGYGKAGSGLLLNLVYNPAGAFLPPAQETLEKEYKQALKENYNIDFNKLLTITNLPVSRYLDFLLKSGQYESYMQKLINAYNPAAAAGVMCKTSVSIGWDGLLYDCDFNQMLELKANAPGQHISKYNNSEMEGREIITGRHCFGCTAGAGSSCGGSIT